jgi:hypothetical protein
MQFIMKEKKTGKLELIESVELAYNMMESGEWLFGFLSFVEKDIFKASLNDMYKVVCK